MGILLLLLLLGFLGLSWFCVGYVGITLVALVFVGSVGISLDAFVFRW